MGGRVCYPGRLAAKELLCSEDHRQTLAVLVLVRAYWCVVILPKPHKRWCALRLPGF